MDQIYITVPKNNELTLSFNANLTSLSGVNLSNDDPNWAYSSTASDHIWTYSGLIDGEEKCIELEALIDPGSSAGSSSFLATIFDGSGGDTTPLNNRGSQSYTYSP